MTSLSGVVTAAIRVLTTPSNDGGCGSKTDLKALRGQFSVKNPL